MERKTPLSPGVGWVTQGADTPCLTSYKVQVNGGVSCGVEQVQHLRCVDQEPFMKHRHSKAKRRPTHLAR
jgi:hypothetical protein